MGSLPTKVKQVKKVKGVQPDPTSKKAKQFSQAYSWKKCADETFAFLRSVYEINKT